VARVEKTAIERTLDRLRSLGSEELHREWRQLCTRPVKAALQC
jgi:hypothetical protein